jgi:hypothetical protein
MAVASRVSAYSHWIRYLLGRRYDSPERFREELAAEGFKDAGVYPLPPTARSLRR